MVVALSLEWLMLRYYVDRLWLSWYRGNLWHQRSGDRIHVQSFANFEFSKLYWNDKNKEKLNWPFLKKWNLLGPTLPRLTSSISISVLCHKKFSLTAIREALPTLNIFLGILYFFYFSIAINWKFFQLFSTHCISCITRSRIAVVWMGL